MATSKKTTSEPKNTDGLTDWLILELAKEKGWTQEFTKDWAEQKHAQSQE